MCETPVLLYFKLTDLHRHHSTNLEMELWIVQIGLVTPVRE